MYLRNELDNFVQTQPNNIMIDNTIMENLHNYIPMDLANIVDEYSKDRTNFDKVLSHSTLSIQSFESLHQIQKPYSWYFFIILNQLKQRRFLQKHVLSFTINGIPQEIH